MALRYCEHHIPWSKARTGLWRYRLPRLDRRLDARQYARLLRELLAAPHFGAILMNFTIETELENDGRWIAEIVEIPGVLKYDATKMEAIGHVEALALQILAERIEHGEQPTEPIHITFAAA